MNICRIIVLFCSFLTCIQPVSAQSKRRRLADFPPFGFPYGHQFSIEREVVCIKYFKGMHGKKDYPYVRYSHQILPGERFSSNMPKWQANSLLRAGLMNRFEIFKKYSKDALLLSMLSYNVGVGRYLAMGNALKVSFFARLKLIREIFTRIL